jgi:transcriptional regulator with XRE-family HTH domain
MNERLRNSIAAAGLTLNLVAQDIGVDPKTVARWITQDRIPHARHRRAAAALVRAEETYLWPALVTEKVAQSATSAELVTLYPHRGAVPGHLWLALAEAAQHAIDVLAFAGLFLWDGHPDLPVLLATKARAGTRIRIALGDPESHALRLRGEEEGIDDALSARVRMSLTYLRQTMKTPGVEVRLHGTTLYNSIYRFDDQLLVNSHAYGAPAAQSPVLYIRHLPGGRLFSHYEASFERVWNKAQQIDHPNVARRSIVAGDIIPN